MKRQEEYQRYLQTKHWRDIKQRMYIKHRRCYDCGKGYTLEVHHKRGYKNIGKERLSELVLLCHSCHYRRHRLRSLNFRTIFDVPIFLFNWIKVNYTIT